MHADKDRLNERHGHAFGRSISSGESIKSNSPLARARNGNKSTVGRERDAVGKRDASGDRTSFDVAPVKVDEDDVPPSQPGEGLEGARQSGPVTPRVKVIV
jgi:hypothetical protein